MPRGDAAGRGPFRALLRALLRRGDAGQTSTEFLGLLVVVAALVGVLVAAGLGTPISNGIQAAICRIVGQSCEPASAQSHRPTDQCEVTSHNAEVSANVVVFSVVVGGRGKYTISKTVDANGKEHWFVQTEGGVRLGAQAELGGGGSAGDFGGGLDGKIKAVLRGDAGVKYEFPDEKAARDFVTALQHEVVKDAVVPPWSPLSGPAHWVMDKVDGKHYDPPDPTSYWFEGGGQVDGSVNATEGVAKGTLSANAATVLRVQVTPQPDGTDHTTYSLKLSAEAAGKLGLFSAVDATGKFSGEVVLSLEYDGHGNAVTATLDGTGTVNLSAGQSLPLGQKPGSTGKLGARDGIIERQTARLKLDLTQGDNRDVLADALHAVGVPVLTGDGATDPPNPLDGTRRLAGLFTDGAPGTYLSTNRYELQQSGVNGELSGGEGVSFGLDGGITFEDSRLVDASYYEPGQGWVRWQECFR